MPSPRRDRMGVPLGRFSLTAAVRMIDGVHHHAAALSPIAEPPRTSCLSDADVLMIHIAHRAYGGSTLSGNIANLPRRHAQLNEASFFRHQLDCDTGAARNLCSFARLQ